MPKKKRFTKTKSLRDLKSRIKKRQRKTAKSKRAMKKNIRNIPYVSLGNFNEKDGYSPRSDRGGMTDDPVSGSCRRDDIDGSGGRDCGDSLLH